MYVSRKFHQTIVLIFKHQEFQSTHIENSLLCLPRCLQFLLLFISNVLFPSDTILLFWKISFRMDLLEMNSFFLHLRMIPISFHTWRLFLLNVEFWLIVLFFQHYKCSTLYWPFKIFFFVFSFQKFYYDVSELGPSWIYPWGFCWGLGMMKTGKLLKKRPSVA